MQDMNAIMVQAVKAARALIEASINRTWQPVYWAHVRGLEMEAARRFPDWLEGRGQYSTPELVLLAHGVVEVYAQEHKLADVLLMSAPWVGPLARMIVDNRKVENENK